MGRARRASEQPCGCRQAPAPKGAWQDARRNRHGRSLVRALREHDRCFCWRGTTFSEPRRQYPEELSPPARFIKSKLGNIPLEGITRKVLIEYLETVPGTVALRRVSRNVWLNMFSLAIARGDAKDNPVAGL